MQTYEDPFPIAPLAGACIPAVHDHAEERAELERVLSHPELSRSVSLVRFLGYICQKYFEERCGEIREHSIAVEALGRKESTFDSQIDPIVRVTARALRKKLRDYYDHDGVNDPLEIVIPLGRYIPQFVPHVSRAERLPVSAESAARLAPGAQSVVNPDQPLTSFASEGITQETQVVQVSAVATTARPRVVWGVMFGLLVLSLVFAAGILYGRRTSTEAVAASSGLQWGDPVWGDEFDGTAMTVPDSTKWTFDVGNQNNWGNHELETYCSPGPTLTKGCDPIHPNAFLDGKGHLVLRALKNADGNWTSARITTRELKNFQYGRIEARMKMPVGTGLWPAFWMLGANMKAVGWPAAGTVDIAENVGLTSRSNGLGPAMIRSSLHGPGYFGGNSLRRDFQLPGGARIDDGGFHAYGIIWSPGMIQFYVDDPANIFFVQNVSNLPEDGEWVFDQPFYLVMNLAVGGDWAGDPDDTTPSPSQIVVDYVRVYRLTPSAPSLVWTPLTVKAGAMISSPVHLQGERGSGRVYVSCSTEPVTVACTLDASTVDFTHADKQEDMLTITTDTVAHNGNVIAKPGTYKLKLTATTISGDRSQITVPFQVVNP